MSCKLNSYLLFILLAWFVIPTQGQSESNEQLKDSTQTLSPEYLPVYTAPVNQHSFFPLQYELIDTQMVEVNHYSPSLNSKNIYQTLGIFEQAHQSMIFDFSRSMGFQYIRYPYPLLFKTQDDLFCYKLETSYTKIGYFYGFSDENALQVNFAQNVKNAIVSINLKAHSNMGYYVYQETQGIVGDAQVQYMLPNKKYGFRASYIINRTANHENNGLANTGGRLDTIQQPEAYPVNSGNGIMHILTQDMNWQHFYTIKTKKLDLGTITHNAQFQTITSSFFDYLDTTFNQIYAFESDSTFDTLRCYKIVNSIQWSNFTPFTPISTANNFIKVATGIMHEYFEDRRTYYSFHSFTPFIRGNIRLIKNVDLYGNFSYSFGGYIHNDAIANLSGEWKFPSLKFTVGVQTDFYRVSPDYIYTRFQSNHFQWDTTFKKQNIAILGAYIKFKEFKFTAKVFLLDQLVLFGPEMTPIQLTKFSRLVQFNLYAPFRYKGFGITTHLCLQNASSDTIQVPLFAGKMNFFYIFDIFKRKLKLQLGVDLMYNTTYYANGYSPAIYSFYYQNVAQIGNYWFVDAHATLRISRLYIFARVGNLLSAVQNNNMFTTPGYPVMNYMVNLGVNWRFHD